MSITIKAVLINYFRTGAGSWTIDVATNYPKAKFIGVDISPVQPDLDKPANVEFMEGNVLESLPFDDNTFDYVFQRLLTSAFPANKWPSVINKLVRVLKPGGYLELMEPDFQYKGNMGPGTKKVDNGIVTMFYDRGIDPHTCYKLQGYLKEHNQLCNVHCEIKKMNADEKLRKLQIKNYSAALVGIKPKLINIIKVSSAEYDDLVKTVEKELSEFDCYFDY
ncbi:14774_t:CDS:2, partial [Racocetra persica]